MPNKVTTLAEAVEAHIQDGDIIFVGGFGQCIPFAIAHEIIRQGRRDLTLCRSGADIVFDLLIAAGCVRKLIVGYIGNPGVGLAHAFRRAVAAGDVEIEEWTNFSLVLRLTAGAMGVPFLPSATLVAGDLAEAVEAREIVCPYSGERLAAVPALTPDVAILHAQRADAAGNIQMFGLRGDTVEGAAASRKVVATVEEIVPAGTVRGAPDRTIVPAFRTAAVAEVPWGAHPSYVHGHYGRDDAAYFAWDTLARDEAALSEWIARRIGGVESFADYVAGLDEADRRALKAEARGHHG